MCLDYNLFLSRYNMLFLLAGGGKFNYQGTKKWIEDNVESSGIKDKFRLPILV